MDRLDKRIDYKMVIDTETCPIDKTCQEVRPDNMLVYDVGWAIVDKRGKVYQTRSFVVADVFLGYKNLMRSAYYFEKVPQYWKDIKAGKRILTSFYHIRQIFLLDLITYGTTRIFAHNMYFDINSLNNTMRFLTNSRYRYFFPKGLEICDTLKMSRDVFGKMPTYKHFCEENGFITKNNQLRFTAEILYKFLTNNLNFTEHHTGLDDVMIEKEIMAYCYRQHKKMRRLLWKPIPA